ncbi:MAG: acyltransferase domain-containing protein, partial [bacterium]|nr:acyltransferase domain-containing protein [bacterium]
GPQAVAVNLPESVTGFSVSEAGERGARLLPLSGKSPGAVRDLARRYVSWLDGQDGSASDALLSDLAWTAGTGRSHLPHRAGLVFTDSDQLRQRLRSLAGSHETPAGEARDGTARVAFAYTGPGHRWMAAGDALYRSEPVARAVLDRCEEVLRGDLDVSLLDAMFGQPGVDHDPALTHPLAYALACALTAQWASIGIRPNAVVGSGPGLPAAAQAAGALGLEEGLRLAAALGVWHRTRSGPDPQAVLKGLEKALAGVTLSEPSVSLVSGASGRVVESIGELEIAYWLRHATEPAGFSGCGRTLDRLGVDVVVEVGLDPMGLRGIGEAWPEAAEAPAVLPALVSPPGDGELPGLDDGFVRAVAGAYEAGLDVSFAGLFSGEVRRRIALPTYPFQRRRHWV